MLTAPSPRMIPPGARKDAEEKFASRRLPSSIRRASTCREPFPPEGPTYGSLSPPKALLSFVSPGVLAPTMELPSAAWPALSVTSESARIVPPEATRRFPGRVIDTGPENSTLPASVRFSNPPVFAESAAKYPLDEIFAFRSALILAPSPWRSWVMIRFTSRGSGICSAELFRL